MRQERNGRLAGRILLALLVTLATGSLRAPAAAPAGAAEPRAESTAAIDINSASVEELMSVPGIGQAIAQRIVEFREKNGPYKTVEDLLKVQGIGEKSLAKISARLTVGKSKK
ncbi:MAG TPA: helix-hairpin-helix domain-containing protein [Candidatus Polarisedimenticolia bacterium]|nr:helix-hairpin-helix domain-containing protein [Candidatus Polarisedimenticolia bacterium]